ncbi:MULTISPECIES: TetR/AcrR family transcriptional regulator [Brachybacterium]|uniref:TetR family transcriptional regulator n=1 Tax=Brachybacterium alimentarium TaxID=47845 RepID=A0A2A3YND7_9MICO|nr:MULTISPECIES: TetR/AcrR family transcriptional regulator [Brachybacterium]PCC32083.1 TetR family transcriptional regulator [Brachybacterium alimentarium]PCC40605.1 TetR family transcriptional regulator [Brachybacterium alimentarium]RCS61755.1 TetR/AcrR family transcriptional regulator [Brachybacterium sp. JB7]RCS69614.1 TetR/AcrR family transcriptional regulator [Brachybacterium alimentarium]RCS71502.1 TetR/AcrR family transcriptional regulator [Brachybacterium alimentarium]
MPRPRIPERRRRILDAARDLALDLGWRSTTVARIAESAGVGKGAVYLEFEDKQAILDAALRRSMQAATAEVHRRVNAADDLVDLPAVYRFGVEALLADPLLRSLHLGDTEVLGDHVRAVDDARYRERFDWLGRYVRRLQSAGVIDQGVDGDVLSQVLSTFTIGLLNAPASIGPITDDALRESVALFADLMGRGLAPAAVERSGTETDPAAARSAQLELLDALTAQLDDLEQT